jgi:phospholipid/cholesterol/gamma-HCH transport system substrate-binding protein
MPRTRSLTWTELKIGIVSIVAVFLATMLIFLLSGDGGFFWQRYPLKTVFASIPGLKSGAPVRVSGVEVGSVTEIAFRGDQVEVTMELRKDNQPRVTSTSVASLGSLSLLGEAAVDITASSTGTPLPEWGYVKSGAAAGSLTDVATQASAGISQATALINDIRGGRGTMGKLFTDEALYRDLDALVSAAEQVARGVNQGKGSLGRLVNDPALARSLEGSVQKLDAILAKVQAGEGSIGKLLNDDALSKSLTSMTANLDGVTAKINKGEGTMGKLVTDQELYNRLNSMTDRLDKIMAGLQQGNGTMGQLMQDKQLYEKLNKTVDEVAGLVAAMKADPKKYLNIKVSLF